MRNQKPFSFFIQTNVINVFRIILKDQQNVFNEYLIFIKPLNVCNTLRTFTG